jgi:hypothetical protein
MTAPALPEFWLKTAAHPSAGPDPRYASLYLRHHGGGINAIMLTPSPPKFLRLTHPISSPPTTGADAHPVSEPTRQTGRIAFTSQAHADRRWGLVTEAEYSVRAGWESVEIVADAGTEGFYFEEEGGLEVLKWNAEKGQGGDGSDGTVADGETDGAWRGWMACEWAHGHPQLFWVTDRLKGELPAFCERVRIVREML